MPIWGAKQAIYESVQTLGNFQSHMTITHKEHFYVDRF